MFDASGSRNEPNSKGLSPREGNTRDSRTVLSSLDVKKQNFADFGKLLEKVRMSSNTQASQ